MAIRPFPSYMVLGRRDLTWVYAVSLVVFERSVYARFSFTGSWSGWSDSLFKNGLSIKDREIESEVLCIDGKIAS